MRWQRRDSAVLGQGHFWAGSALALLLPEITARRARPRLPRPRHTRFASPGPPGPLRPCRGRCARGTGAPWSPARSGGTERSRGLARSRGRRGCGAGIQPAGPGGEPGAERGLLGSSLNSRRRAAGLAGAFLGSSIRPQPPCSRTPPALGFSSSLTPPLQTSAGASTATRARPGLFRLDLAAAFGLFPVTPRPRWWSVRPPRATARPRRVTAVPAQGAAHRQHHVGSRAWLRVHGVGASPAAGLRSGVRLWG